jgi:hypothetical protein
LGIGAIAFGKCADSGIAIAELSSLSDSFDECSVELSLSESSNSLRLFSSADSSDSSSGVGVHCPSLACGRLVMFCLGVGCVAGVSALDA